MSKLLLCKFTVIYREQVPTDNYCYAEKERNTCLSFDNSPDMRIAVWNINTVYSYSS